MDLKISFINPNTKEDADKYLPQILAAAIVNKVANEHCATSWDKNNEDSIKHSA